MSPLERGPWLDAVMLLTVSIMVGTLWLVVPLPAKTAIDAAAQVDDLSAARAEAAALRDSLRVAEQRASLGSARRDRASQRAASMAARRSELEAEVVRREQAVADARQRLTATQRPDVSSLVGTPTAERTEKKPAIVVLRNDRVVVFGDDTYDSDRVPLGNTTVTRARPTDSGETIEEAKAPDSRLRAALEELDPSEDFVALVVASNSFAAFRVVRELARSEGIAVGWEPYTGDDGTLWFSTSGRAMSVQRPGGGR